MLRASRRPRIGFMSSPVPTLSWTTGAGAGVGVEDVPWLSGEPPVAVVDIAKWNASPRVPSAARAVSTGDEKTGDKAVERRNRANRSMRSD